MRVLGYVCCVVFHHSRYRIPMYLGTCMYVVIQSPAIFENKCTCTGYRRRLQRLTLFSVASSTAPSVASTSCSRFCSSSSITGSSVLANLLLPLVFFLPHLNFFFPPDPFLFLLRLLKMKALSIEIEQRIKKIS